MAIIEYAFLNNDDLVETIAVFNNEINTDESVNEFAKATGYAKAINCETYGKPYIGDTWDGKSWIETASRVSVEPVEITNG